MQVELKLETDVAKIHRVWELGPFSFSAVVIRWQLTIRLRIAIRL